MDNKMIPLKRRKARETALQALYSWQISRNNLSIIKNYIFKDNNIKKIDLIYFNDIFYGVIQEIIHLDNIIAIYLHKNIKELGEIEKSILRISIYEIKKRKDVPHKVIINEGIELAKKFGTYKSHKFINGILDKVIKNI